MDVTKDELYRNHIAQVTSEASQLADSLAAVRASVRRMEAEIKRKESTAIQPADIEAASHVMNSLFPDGTTREQAAVAMMLGRGMTPTEVVEYVSVPGGVSTVFTWMVDPSFRGLLDFWQDVTDQEQRSVLIRELNILTQMNLEPAMMIRVSQIRQRLGDQNQTRMNQRAQLRLKQREVEARERLADRRDRRQKEKPKFVEDPIDVEYEDAS